MYKWQDKQKLIIAGHLDDKEIQALKQEGYMLPQVNKHGIRVVQS